MSNFDDLMAAASQHFDASFGCEVIYRVSDSATSQTITARLGEINQEGRFEDDSSDLLLSRSIAVGFVLACGDLVTIDSQLWYVQPEISITSYGSRGTIERYAKQEKHAQGYFDRNN